jgi:hypothetical protein
VQVAVVAVGVVKRAADDEVDVVTVGNRFVDAAGRVPATALHGGAGARAGAVHLQPVLVGVTLVRRVEVPVVQVIGVIAVADLPVAAAGAVVVVVSVVLRAGHRSPRGIVSLERTGVNP